MDKILLYLHNSIGRQTFNVQRYQPLMFTLRMMVITNESRSCYNNIIIMLGHTIHSGWSWSC